MTDPAVRLAEIRERRKPGTALTLAILINDAKTTHPFTGDEPVIVHGCVVSNAAVLKAEVRQVWFHDLPDLVAALEAVLTVVATTEDRTALAVREALAAALDKEKTTDADS